MLGRTIFVFVATILLAGGSALRAPPEWLSAVNRTWTSNADGYVFTVAYFTEAEVSDKRWEMARRKSRKLAVFCKKERIVRRDVRWFEPESGKGPRCAMLIYSIACSPRRPEWGGSLDYEREEALLKEPERQAGPHCGDKHAIPAHIPSSTPAEDQAKRRAERDKLISRNARCFADQDLSGGAIRIQPATKISRETLLSPDFDETMPEYWKPPGAADILPYAARESAQVHAIFSKRALPNDGTNILLSLIFAGNSNQSPYCVTLVARQGANIWRKTVVRPRMLEEDRRKWDDNGHPRDPETYWTPNADAHTLGEELALALGLPLGRHAQNPALSRNRPPSFEN